MSDSDSDISSSAPDALRKPQKFSLSTLASKGGSKKNSKDIESSDEEESVDSDDDDDDDEESGEDEEDSDESDDEPVQKLSKRQKAEFALDMLQKLQKCDRNKFVAVPFVGQHDSYDTIKTAFDKWTKLKNRDSGVKLQKTVIGGAVKVIEFIAGATVPDKVDLNGWHASFQPMLDEQENEEIFEELYDKYGSLLTGDKASPEWRLAMLLIKSGVMFAIGKRMASEFSPEKMMGMMGMAGGGSGGGGSGNIMSGMMGGLMGGGNTHPSQFQQQPQPQRQAGGFDNNAHTPPTFDLLAELKTARANIDSRGKGSFPTPSVVSGVSRVHNSKGQAVALL